MRLLTLNRVEVHRQPAIVPLLGSSHYFDAHAAPSVKDERKETGDLRQLLLHWLDVGCLLGLDCASAKI